VLQTALHAKRRQNPAIAAPLGALSSEDLRVRNQGNVAGLVPSGGPRHIRKRRETMSTSKGGSHEQHVKAGEQSHKNTGSQSKSSDRQETSRGGTHEQHVNAGKQSSGGTHEQHVKAGEQSHKND
jgi:hypothetical protein